MIDHEWFTKRLTIRDTRNGDLPALEQVLESNSSSLLLDGIETVDPRELSRCLTEGDLPPRGRLEHYRLQTILRKDTNDAIGYLSLYHGYPDAETLYIASMFIRQACQSHGFGREVVDELILLKSLLPYPKHRLVVTVRNWGAVRFWVRSGFTNIVRVQGEIDGPAEKTARLELVREHA